MKVVCENIIQAIKLADISDEWQKSVKQLANLGSKLSSELSKTLKIKALFLGGEVGMGELKMSNWVKCISKFQSQT